MTWLATLHGDTSHLSTEDSASLEATVLDKLKSIAGGLVGDGHQGVGATFHGDHSGDVNLLDPGATPDAGPQAPAPAGDQAEPPQLEIPRDSVDPAAGGAPGSPPELTPGQALAPTTPEADPDAQQGHPGELGAGEGQEA